MEDACEPDGGVAAESNLMEWITLYPKLTFWGNVYCALKKR